MRAGRNMLTITNDYDHEVVIRLERCIPMSDVVTAAKASCLPEFREMFPHEAPQLGRLLNVATVTFMAVEIANLDDLFVRLGDGETWSVVQRLHDLIREVMTKHDGTLVKLAGTDVLYALDSPQSAVQAVGELSEAVRNDPKLDVQLCAAVHRGTALATSAEGSLDYFGSNVHVVSRLLRQADAGELMMTEAVASDPEVVAALVKFDWPSEVCGFPTLGKNGTRCQRLSLR